MKTKVTLCGVNEITQELKNDLIATLHDAEQLSHWLKTLPSTMDDDVLIELSDNITHWLSKYINEDDKIKEIN